MLELGELIRSKRRLLRLSQREVAKKANISRSYVSELESGTRRTDSLDVLLNLSNALDLPMKDVLAAAGYDCNDENAMSRAPLPPEVQYMADVIANAPPPYRDELMKSVREFATAWEHLLGLLADEEKEASRHEGQPKSSLL